jgi:pimeloyl-ACP methyl ester carboxylesterase
MRLSESQQSIDHNGIVYMATDTTNLTLSLKDGRRLGYAEYGLLSGSQAAFFFPGSASSRLDHPYPEELLARLNIHLISVDRPGCGLSDFQKGRRLLDTPQDITQLADYLKIERFTVIGHSAGGPHALACAHQLPERVLTGVTISSVAPMHRPNAYRGMPLMNQILARSARYFPGMVYLIRWMMLRMIMGDIEKTSQRLMSSIPDTGREVLYDSQASGQFVSAVREGIRPGSRGVAQDDILINRDWGFDLAEIKPRNDIWHGDADVNVPVGAGRYLGDRLPNARVTILPGEGHFFLIKYWEKILAVLLDTQEIAV